MRTPALRAKAIAVVLSIAALALASCGSDRPPAEGATTIEVDGTYVHAIERSPQDATARRPTVLFLHGQAYDSRIWDDRGILDAVASSGSRAVAVDLPGFGETPERRAGEDDPGADARWLRTLVDELGGPAAVVLVSPSMSGRYSLPYLAIHPDDPIAGFVPVAPVGTDGFSRGPDARPVPSLVVYGEDDPARTPAREARLVEELGGEPVARLEVIAGGSHAAYDDEPEAFTDALLAFLADLPR